ncbi:LytR/AlgR family response regulator transcription factor [Tellurirhabdus rosea]|uniref:LytR/AlgR family response regulator transcription factor n=1 Tax=Tellurirhabdus rosea TaxID=2674997 RepID=UPI002259B536|nr:LytTR family DNA-binding domain-containing protein [Tellurirhabdus rosea]
MKSCRCLVIEDSPQFTALLKEYLARIPYMATPVFAGSVREAIALLQQPFDLIFLDIHLPDLSGLEILQSFPQLPPVIVTTSAPEYAVACYDFDVADYLVKPYSFTRFMRAVNRACPPPEPGRQRGEESLFLKVGHAMQRFDLASIDIVQAYGIYCKIIGGGKTAVVNETISSLENKLPPNQFMRVHKSYIINLKNVFSYSHRTIFIASVEVPLGTAYRDRFRMFLGLEKTQEN